MARPSDELLRWLRSQLDAAGHNTATVAGHLGKPRPLVRKALTGEAPMELDDMVKITELLELDPTALGLALPEAGEHVEPAPAPKESAHWSNQPRALFEFGFELGVDFMFLTKAEALGDDWGGPDHVLAQYRGKELPLRLDANFQKYMEPEFTDTHVTIVLSFDQLYRCRFPWAAITRVIFMPYPPAAPDEEPEEGEDGDADTGSAPFLRLVT